MGYDDELKISDLITRGIAGELDTVGQSELDAWLAQSDDHRRLYDRIASGESLSRYIEQAAGIDQAANMAAIESRLASRARRRRRGIAAAAIAAAAVMAGAVMLFGPAADELSGGGQTTMLSDAAPQQVTVTAVDAASGQGRVITVTVPRSGEYQQVLADGTKVWLNMESRLEYPEEFASDRREVKLSGEAYFEVAGDPARPFIITTEDGLSIRVLGTKFNVYSYADNPDTQVTVVEGSVAVSSEQERVVLGINEQAVFSRDDSALTVRHIDDPSSLLAWKNGRFDFQSETLPRILDAVGRWYGVDISARGVDLDTMGHFTFKANRRDDVTHVLDMLRRVTGLEYSVEGDKVEIGVTVE